MSEFNKEYASPSGAFEDSEGVSRTERMMEHFVECPGIFTAALTPEQYKARQQLYQVAYAKAIEEVRKRQAAFVPPFVWGDTGDGI